MSLLDLPDGGVLHLLPEGYGLFVPNFDPVEPGAGLLVHLGMVLGLLMIADVQVHQLPDAVLVHGLDAPLLIGHDHLAELGAPVPQMVHAHGLVPQVLIDAV